MDYQSRYLAHQKRKKESLQGKYEKEKTYTKGEISTVKKVFKNRNSSRNEKKRAYKVNTKKKRLILKER